MKNQNGFTLIELMIIVLIIMILAAVIIGATNGESGTHFLDPNVGPCLAEDPNCGDGGYETDTWR